MAFGHPAAIQLGASGVVFSLILLNSLLAVRVGKIPLTFVCQVVLWIYKEVVEGLWSSWMGEVGGTSNCAHLSGALVGTIFGFKLHQERLDAKMKVIGSKWLKTAKEKAK